MKIVLIYKQNLDKWHELIDKSTKKKERKKGKNKQIDRTNSKNHSGRGGSPIFLHLYFHLHLRDFPRAVQALRPDDKFRHGSMINWISKVTPDATGGGGHLATPSPLRPRGLNIPSFH